jgi:diguanylate cyclase (GGDEF)-like protein
MIKVRVISKKKISIPSQFITVEQDEDLVLAVVLNEADLELVRLIKNNIPIIIIAKDSKLILDVDVDDYMLWPFVEEEFVIRAEVLLAKKEKRKSPYEDGLTGVYNKNYYYLIEQNNFIQDIAVVMVDFDNFKQVNDNYGHLRGDEILQKAGEIFKKSVLGSDVVIRFGGDEFLIILFDTDTEGAYIVAERIRKNMQNICEVSAGVSGLNLNEEISEAIARADQALYEAKAKGKNLVLKK